MSSLKRLTLAALSLFIAAAIWLPSIHLFFNHPDQWLAKSLLPPRAGQLANQQLHLWRDPAFRKTQTDAMRRSNAEWDFMSRNFLAWSLANIAIADPSRLDDCLTVIDTILDETLRLEREKSMYHFLMPYSLNKPYVHQPARSLFVDSEIALTLGLRLLVQDKSDYRPLLRERIDSMTQRLQRHPLHIAESYPNECWLFDHGVALASMRVADAINGTDHSAFFKTWIASAREHLIDPSTGLLCSSFTLDNVTKDGPEGSSIWMSAHCLALIDQDFARDQYRRARAELYRNLCGFGFAREWPATWQGDEDVDSGPIVPVLGISAGSTGLCFIGARTFNDSDTLRQLYTTLDFAGFPQNTSTGLRYCASNNVGDAVMLYGAVLGPAWQRTLQLTGAQQ